MTHIIKSHEWKALHNLPVPVLLTALELITNAVETYEENGGRYPQIEFYIGLAMDRLKESEAIKHREKSEAIKHREKSEAIEAIEAEQATEEVEVVEVKQVNEEPWRTESPTSRRRRISESWSKFEQQKSEVSEVSEATEATVYKGRRAARKAKKEKKEKKVKV